MQTVIYEYGRTLVTALTAILVVVLVVTTVMTASGASLVQREAQSIASDGAAKEVLSRDPPIVYCNTLKAGKEYPVDEVIDAIDMDGRDCRVYIIKVLDSRERDITSVCLKDEKMCFEDHGLYTAHVRAIDDLGRENNCWVNISVNGAVL